MMKLSLKNTFFDLVGWAHQIYGAHFILALGYFHHHGAAPPIQNVHQNHAQSTALGELFNLKKISIKYSF